ncbi:4Fe-4S binding protein [Mobilitalea sibirica]|uniref:4Fe-4S binding protein n=1 Tax=Mobilitalea sibirica TaxID=1462919 RepID=A0A8J7KSU6_9FIRM|nr:[Fe-Fe] hydrogenase large subunit C-terminal domain-containing protein [Mobilitalea sibirica]MBH1940671.1 4Fe-4S binding protein [Mobilitalea sibirica]
MNHYIQLKKANCKNCYKCIRHCPVKSIKFADHQAHIVKDQCILCGECFVACPQNAKQIRNDVDVAKSLIASGHPVFASIAPSFVANYKGSDIHSLRNTLIKLGFAGAEETALGATVVKKLYEGMLQQNDGRVIISSCCHTVNTLIQKYYPNALPYLADVISPMQAHCMKIKKEHPDALTVFIGPCISKKEEAELYPGIVDCALTFEELSGWLTENNLSIEESHEQLMEVEGKARLFPISGGILRTMNLNDTDYDVISVDGVDNCIRALNDIIQGKSSNLFIEMSACTGSCIGGPAMDKQQLLPITDYIAIQKYAKKNDFPISVSEMAQYKKTFSYIGNKNQMPGSSAIAEILKKMGKAQADQELNCGSCGYNTCRDKAIAVYQGKADLTMCLPFLKEKAENFSDNIIYNMPSGVLVLNENLEVQQINRAARQIFNIKNKLDILGSPVIRILNPSAYLNVMTTGRNIHDKLTYLAEYQRYIEETVIYDKTYHIIISIMRDITTEEKSRLMKEEVSKKTIEITDKVIEKQMRVVQEIASLLGETAAETKIALTNLKETLKDE